MGHQPTSQYRRQHNWQKEIGGMMKGQLLTLALVAVLVPVVSVAAAAQSQPEQLTGEGAIVAFHKQWRHPVWNSKSREMSEFATRADLWIVRIDRWMSGRAEGKYFLVNYMLYERAVSNREVNQSKLRFHLRAPQEAEGPKPCLGVAAGGRMTDFQRTQPGQTDSIPRLKDLPCLVAEKPPTVVKATGGPAKRQR
ncbi:MAG TPA: hypothetical protein VN577_09520 [Terriglobales bacterium]|nr:hypothetical protein [Terriglobales bacterium]